MVDYATPTSPLLHAPGAGPHMTCDPADLPTVRDLCSSRLRTVRALPTEPKVAFHGAVVLELAEDDRAAVDALLTAHRRQTIDDTLRHQRMQPVATDLADPAAALAWWLDHNGAGWDSLPSSENLGRIAEIMGQYRHTRDQPLEYRLLEILRSFLSSFPDDRQSGCSSP